ncbi:hypothetical protein RSOL_003620, partial [Rhizoctonia solani AG-3 Rhs1AP]
MSRKLRRGRSYDAGTVPVAPKRQVRKREAPGETKTEEPKRAVRDSGEQAIVSRKVQLTFGTTSGVTSDHGEGVVIVGTGKRRGIALGVDAGVKLSLAAYLALMHRAPPITRVMSWSLPTPETREAADAPIEGEATAPSSVEAAECAPGVRVTSGSADCAPAASSAPTTPAPTTRVDDSETDREVFVTAGASQVRDDTMALDRDDNPVLAQYVVNGNASELPTSSRAHKKHRRCESKGKARASEPIVSLNSESKSTASNEGLTWDEEMCRVSGEGTYTELYGDLPDVSEWVNPGWLHSDYLRGPTTTHAETDTNSVHVNALFFKVDEDYVFDDEEYATVLRNLRENERSESIRRQTRGAGPSRSYRTHHVTVEDVDGDSDATATSRTQSYTGKGKGKQKSKKKSKKHKRPSLGVTLEELEGSRERLTRPCESFDNSVNYRGGGYFEQVVGATPARKGSDSKAKGRGSASRSSSRRNPTSPRRAAAPLRRPGTTPKPLEPSDGGSNYDGTTHTGSSDGSSESAESESQG